MNLDFRIAELNRLSAQAELSYAERRELMELRQRVAEMELAQFSPPESESEPRRFGAPLTLTSGGIQYQVELTIRQ